MSAPDRRSVGELLLDTELIARQILMDGPDLQAPAMVRTWGEVVQAAGDLWRALPQATPPMARADRQPRRPGDDVMMGRLQEMSTALHRSLRGQPWPGAGPAGEQLAIMAENLGRAAELVQRAEPASPDRADTLADLGAAKARLMHALYLGSHGVAVALDNQIGDLQLKADVHQTRLWRAHLKVAKATRVRIGAFEQLAGGYVGQAYPHALDGEHRDPASPSRLAQALASWDIQAHRALVSDPGPGTLARVARTQTLIADHGHAVLDAGVRTGQLRLDQYRTRLGPALDAAQDSWRRTAQRWNQLTAPSQRHLAPATNLAAGEVRAAFLKLDFDRTGPASPTVMAARTDLTVAAQAVQQALSSSVEIAHLMRELVDDPQLRGAARTLNAMAGALAEVIDKDAGTSGPTAAWVSPRDITANRPTALPELVRDACRKDLETTIDSARDAMDAAAILDAPTGAQAQPAPARGTRARRDHPPPEMHLDAPGVGCER